MRSYISDGTAANRQETTASPRDCHDMEAGISLDMLVGELQHRIRNLLTVVQCLVGQTEALTVEEYRVALSARIVSLNEAYNLIERTCAHRIPLGELLDQTLKPYAAAREDRILAAGPNVELHPRLAFSLHMVFHELATNASKHGALSSAAGQVEVLWRLLSDDAGRRLALQWHERGGPEVQEPDKKGFGLNLITKVLRNAQVRLSFDRAGLVCQMLVKIDEC